MMQFGDMSQDQLRAMLKERMDNGNVVFEEASNLLESDYYKAIIDSKDFYDGLMMAGQTDVAIAKVLFNFLQSPITVSIVVATTLAAYNRVRARALLEQID